MANSNENTQNPKENQEKIADEGIQEHSEHTAENKQPESEENAQKKDESTCLCQFFKKIAGWICARKNKNSNNADENATENNDAAKQAEIKQADTVEQPKEQRKLTDYLEIINKLLSILTIFGTITGGFFIYKYLENIGQLSIFPEIITNPSVFIVAAIIFGSIFLLFLMLVSTSYFTGVKLYKLYNVYPARISRILLSIFIIEVIILVLFFTLILFCYFSLDKNCNDHIIFFNNLSFIINTCFAFLLLGLGKIKIKQKITTFKRISHVCILLALIVAISLILFYYKTLIFNSINFVRFAEAPGNSSWYLVHNNFQQNNGFQETNGINKSDLKKLKKYFTKPKQCSKLELRENALYGYMAWNLGDTKVFCPRSLDNRIHYKNYPIPENCIVISGKALQIMPEGYISTEPIQQPKYDAKEPAIEINCCNCNPNPPRNKDGHPDIGYTDKKICQ